MTAEERKRCERICQIFAIPEFLVPWLDRFFEDREFELILTLASGPLTVEELARGKRLAAESKGESFQQF